MKGGQDRAFYAHWLIDHEPGRAVERDTAWGNVAEDGGRSYAVRDQDGFVLDVKPRLTRTLRAGLQCNEPLEIHLLQEGTADMVPGLPDQLQRVALAGVELDREAVMLG